MRLHSHSLRRSVSLATIIVSLLVSGCTPRVVATPTPLPTDPPTRTAALTPTVMPVPLTPTVTPISITPLGAPSPVATLVPLPTFSLNPGEFYFRLDGKSSFIFSRNIAGYQQRHYATFLDWTRTGGSRLARIQLDSLGMGYTAAGAVDEAWAQQWEEVFDQAEADGIYLLPVFSGWFDWNAGSGYSTWKSNPLNEANGGPIKTPADLFQKDSAAQTLWLKWLQSLVQRWQSRRNIAAWEIFSEVNLASGVSEAAGIDFANSAAAVIQAADPRQRPITASLADDGRWPRFYQSATIDFINAHPYPPSAQLDRNIIEGVRQSLVKYHRPVLIGESGLSAATPDSEAGKLTVAENASRGVEHAIWAAIVSGAMNGRALYWEDSFAIYFPNLGTSFAQKYASADLAASKFVADLDFTGYQPLTAQSSGAIFGAVVGNEKTAIGWFRDATSEPPDWNVRPVISKQSVIIIAPGSAARWKVDFYDTKTGTHIIASAPITRQDRTLTINLPDFTDDVAFKLYSQPP